MVPVDLDRKQPPPSGECVHLLNRITASAEFRRAHRMRAFLSFVVERSLASSPSEITETVIGQQVFGRPATYNPSEDSIVRTEARLLRMRLDRYFAGDGKDEPIILEIPKGAYVPVFRWRVPAAPDSPAPARSTRRYWLAACATAPLTAFAGWRLGVRQSSSVALAAALPSLAPGRVRLESSDGSLVNAFNTARTRALSVVYTGDKIGDWYDGSMGERYSFCARDVAHQATGAAVLGLAGHTQNMLRRLAASVSRERNWCGQWEINKDGFPIGDHYCLPANFDVLQACYRQFLWRGDEAYFDGVFSQFYDRTMTSFIEQWGRSGGVLGSAPELGSRAVPTYWAHLPRPLTGGDLMATQYAAHVAYSRIQERKGAFGSLSRQVSLHHTGLAQELRLRYNTDWWNAEWNRHYSALMPDGGYLNGYIDDANTFALLFRLPEDGAKTNAALDALEAHRPAYDQTYSYFPEILFRHGRKESAMQRWRELAMRDPSLPKIPEISFALIGDIATGLMGLAPDAPASALETLPRVPRDVDWVRLSNVPVLRNEVTVLHRASAEAALTNESGPPIQWKPAFAADPIRSKSRIEVDGKTIDATWQRRPEGAILAGSAVSLKPGQTRTAKLVG